jgi:hypothetical protein
MLDEVMLLNQQELPAHLKQQVLVESAVELSVL